MNGYYDCSLDVFQSSAHCIAWCEGRSQGGGSMGFVVLRPNINQKAANVFKELPWNHTQFDPPPPIMSSRYSHLPPPASLDFTDHPQA